MSFFYVKCLESNVQPFTFEALIKLTKTPFDSRLYYLVYLIGNEAFKQIKRTHK